jgi:hypothetical protein
LIIAVVSWKFIFNSRLAYAAVLAPKETEVFFVINPDLGQKKNAENIRDTYLAIPEVKKAWDDFQKDIEDNNNISYERDIKPWFGGEAAYYITDIDMGEKYVFAFATKDKKKSDAFMEKFCEGKASDKETYKGIEIVTFVTAREGPGYEMLSYAHINNCLIIASSDESIRQAIDNSQNKGRDSLSKDENYKKVLAQLPKSRLGSAYLSSDALTKDNDLKEYLKYTSTELPKGVGMSLSCEKEGIRMDYVTSSGDSEAEKTDSNIAGTLGITPGDAVAYMGIADMRAGFEELADYFEEVSQFEYYNPLYDVACHIRDLASRINGEMAVIIPRDSTALNAELYDGSTDIGVLVFGVNDTEALNRKMQGIVEDYAGNDVYVDTIGGSKVFCVNNYGEEFFCYGFRDNYLIFASSPENLCCALETESGYLSDNKSFKKAVSNNRPSEMDGCLYLDVAGMVDLIRDSSPGEFRKEFDKEIYPFIKPIKRAAFYSKTTKKANKGTLFININ